MTPAQLLKAELKKLEIDITAFEEVLDIDPGTLDKDEWPAKTIAHVYAELHAVYEIEIPELEKYIDEMSDPTKWN